MTDTERIEEAHGLWELAVARQSGVLELALVARPKNPDHDPDAFDEILRRVTDEERAAFAHWQRVSNTTTEFPLRTLTIRDARADAREPA